MFSNFLLRIIQYNISHLRDRQKKAINPSVKPQFFSCCTKSVSLSQNFKDVISLAQMNFTIDDLGRVPLFAVDPGNHRMC